MNPAAESKASSCSEATPSVSALVVISIWLGVAPGYRDDLPNLAALLRNNPDYKLIFYYNELEGNELSREIMEAFVKEGISPTQWKLAKDTTLFDLMSEELLTFYIEAIAQEMWGMASDILRFVGLKKELSTNKEISGALYIDGDVQPNGSNPFDHAKYFPVAFSSIKSVFSALDARQHKLTLNNSIILLQSTPENISLINRFLTEMLALKNKNLEEKIFHLHSTTNGWDIVDDVEYVIEHTYKPNQKAHGELVRWTTGPSAIESWLLREKISCQLISCYLPPTEEEVRSQFPPQPSHVFIDRNAGRWLPPGITQSLPSCSPKVFKFEFRALNELPPEKVRRLSIYRDTVVSTLINFSVASPLVSNSLLAGGGKAPQLTEADRQSVVVERNCTLL